MLTAQIIRNENPGVRATAPSAVNMFRPHLIGGLARAPVPPLPSPPPATMDVLSGFALGAAAPRYRAASDGLLTGCERVRLFLPLAWQPVHVVGLLLRAQRLNKDPPGCQLGALLSSLWPEVLRSGPMLAGGEYVGLYQATRLPLVFGSFSCLTPRIGHLFWVSRPLACAACSGRSSVLPSMARWEFPRS